MNNRDLRTLVDVVDPAWPLVLEWLTASGHRTEVLEPNSHARAQAILGLQVTTHSVLGSVAWETGGLRIDHGWLRLLGSGHPRMRGSLLTWNGFGQGTAVADLPGALIVAHDVVGGFFAINGGALDGNRGDVFYLAPETLEWESLDTSYANLVQWALTGDLDAYYADLRWPEWITTVEELTGDQGLSIYPPLWTGGTSMAHRSLRAVPMIELWNLQLDLAAQVADVPTDSPAGIPVLDGST